MSKIRDRAEDFKDAVNRGLCFHLLFTRIHDDFANCCITDMLNIMKSDCILVLILSEKLHSVTSQFDQLRAVRFQDAINRAMPRRKPKRQPVKASTDVGNNLESREQTSSDTRDPSEVELSSLLDAARDTETKMVEMSALNHLLSTHVLQQAQQIEYLYDQNVEMGNKELTQAIQRNSSSRTFLLLFLVVLTFSVLFLDWYKVQTTSSPRLLVGEVSGSGVISTSSASMRWLIDMVSGLLAVDSNLSRIRETGKVPIDGWNCGGMMPCCGDFYKDGKSSRDDSSAVSLAHIDISCPKISPSKRLPIYPQIQSNRNQKLGFVVFFISAALATFGAAKMVKGRQGERVRLYTRGTVLGYKRSKSNQYPNTSLIQIEGVNTKEEVTWYQGKRMAYIYKAKVKKNGSHYRCIWGKVTRPHGNTGVVRAKFKSNLPPKSMGARVRVFMYPSNI
ncbi:hypothetical protein L1987_62308 [Smallanthus sonchifolius]|uniref:Uncharacterized protein n=1 Tax=Smallanthus sonchifolius TaxID=185202 RepID=A0ACB9CA39_9ASTR|nr:hypothetical protein L1987_62308 [Smallanthus sonchifolius]